MGEHTPGPWTFSESDLRGGRYYSVDRPSLPQSEPIDIHEDENGKADALLIAAAPDLLAALQRTLSWLTSYQGSAAMGKDGPYEQARAAIAKATGTPS